MSTNATKVPGPPARWFGIPLARQFRARPLEFLCRLAREYGDIAGFRIGGLHVFLLNHPDYIAEVLIEQRENFPKLQRHVDAIRRFTGDNVFVGKGDFWLQNRRALQPAFRVEHMQRYVRHTAAGTAAMLDRWPAEGTLDVAEEMTRLAVCTVGEALLGYNVEDRCSALVAAGKIRSRLQAKDIRSSFRWPDWVPTRDRRERRRALRVMNAFVADAIRHRRQQQGPEGDALAQVLAAAEAATDDPQQAAKLAHDQAMMMFNAGYDTTAVALTWIWHLVAGHPDVQRRLRDEALQTLDDRQPGFDDLERLPYTQMVIFESMRLYPTTWLFLPREAQDDTQIGGFEIPRKSWVCISPYVTHRNPRLFRDPARFDPERFCPERAAAIPQHAYFPFSFGPRVCIGKPLALAEMAVIVATVLQRYRLSTPPGRADVELVPSIALRPKGGLPLVVERLAPEPAHAARDPAQDIEAHH